MSSILTAFFSIKGETYMGGSIVKLPKGNSNICAEMISNAVGGTLFEIIPDKVYPADYYALTDVAKIELKNKEMVPVKNVLPGIDNYDTIFLCFPSWWGTIPMAVASFLNSYDFTGKKIFPLCTNEGSGMGGSVGSIQKFAKGASVDSGLSIRGTQVQTSKAQIEVWAKQKI